LIARSAGKVIGIECVEEAVTDARINTAMNSINNVYFFKGDIKDVLSGEFINTNGKPDVIIADPPRAGMHSDVVRAILNAAPDRIVYISCNPATQSRDIYSLSERYFVAKVQPVDMFPQTHHVENVVLLKIREI
jgi:23S rRNA (uracil1939-C5)-methyltransferase